MVGLLPRNLNRALSTEKHRTRPRAVDLRVAGRAVGVLRVLIMLRPGRFRRTDVVSQAVASQAKLIDRAEAQQTRIRRAMRRVASRASFSLYRRMFVSEWTLFVSVALDATCVRAGREPGLLQLKSAMRIMTITATDRAFENFVVEGRIELRLNFAVATQAKLRVTRFQHPQSTKTRFLLVHRTHKDVRARQVLRDHIG